MIRAVFDANTILSGMARFRTGTRAPAVILRAWVNNEFELLISDHILDEIVRNLSKPYFVEHVDPDVYREMLIALAEQVTLVEITQTVSGVATHPEDDLVLSAAISGSADFLMTRDKPFKRVGNYQGCSISSLIFVIAVCRRRRLPQCVIILGEPDFDGGRNSIGVVHSFSGRVGK